MIPLKPFYIPKFGSPFRKIWGFFYAQNYRIILDFNLSYFEANIMKYVVRWKRKNGLEDLYKAREYLNRLIMEEEGKTTITPETNLNNTRKLAIQIFKKLCLKLKH